MRIEHLLGETVAKAVEELYEQKVEAAAIQVQKTSRDYEGELTIVVFPLLRFSKKAPEQTGLELGAYLKEKIEEIQGYDTVTGFLNLTLSDAFWSKTLTSIASTDRYGFAEKDSGSTLMVEYSSPNTNKPLHLGHLRNNFLGYSVSEILKANGHKVYKTQIINDRGIHICKSMLAWKKWGDGETPESSGLKGDKIVGKYYVLFDQKYKEQIKELVNAGDSEEEAAKKAPVLIEAQEMLIKWEANDPEVRALWEQMNGWVYQGFDQTYERMGVDFDKLYYESDTYLVGRDEVLKGKETGIFYEREDGSVWIDLKEDGLDEKLMLRSDGTSVYMTQDLGTALLRHKDYPDLRGIIYTVGDEQEYHFKVLFNILGKLGYDWSSSCYHLSYGMVDLPTGKMKSREGTVVDADDLMEEVVQAAAQMTAERGKLDEINEDEREALFDTLGLGALKYYLLKVGPRRRMLFDPEESVSLDGDTGPFIQYAYARSRAIARKAGKVESLNVDSIKLEPKERDLIIHLYEYPEAIKLAGEEYNPAIIAGYAFELAKRYNQFYHEVPILAEQDAVHKYFRVLLSDVSGRVIASALSLLGMSVPERM